MDSSSEGEPGLALLQLTPCLSLGSLTRRLASGERASGVPRRPGISTAGAACLLPAALEAQAKVGLAGVSVNIRTPLTCACGRAGARWIHLCILSTQRVPGTRWVPAAAWSVGQRAEGEVEALGLWTAWQLELQAACRGR